RPDHIESKLNSETGNISTGTVTGKNIEFIRKYPDLDACLRSEDTDAVIICTHTHLHYDMTKMALLNNKHVFLEKPFCLDIQQGEELINLAKNKGLVLMIGHVVRFMPPYQKLKKWLDSGEFGNLKFLSLSRLSGIPVWGDWTNKNITDKSGGALFDLVIHDIDFVSWVLGIPDEITAGYLPGQLSNHDYISASWSYKDKGILVKIEGGNIFHATFPFQSGYIAGFENATINYTTLKGDVIGISDDKKMKEVPAGDIGEGYYNEIEYFAGCLKNNSEPSECTPESSLMSVRLCYEHLKK
ncbi:MAG TPA: hypothetical protein DDW27_06510, partial [Bacteroidales bacterium]|nr:hypothetical protein [Bacteroidales bacterium]